MLYGRDAERAQIGALLDGARASHSGVLVIRGEPGIGKTALLEDARDRAADMQVLVARGVESEAELPFAGLHQLLRPALPLLEQLPTPQANALKGALGLAGRGGDDRFLISLAVLTLLAELAERRPVLCLVDDAQWLDAPSADALLFVARRLDAEALALLLAAREGDVRTFEVGELPSLTLQGLDDEAAAELLARDLGGELAPSVRDFLLEQGGGNALALVELPAALSDAQLAGREPLPERLPVTRGVERLFLERVRRLPPPTRRLLLLAAADDRGGLAPVLRAAAALGIDADALASAERAGLVSVRGSQLELRHPLVRSAVYQGASSSERSEAHLALAEALAGELEADRRAWHRAAAARRPDAEIAEELEASAERARRRSGHAAAATALERAAELSVDSDSRSRRLVAAGRAAWHAGQVERSLTLLDRASPIAMDTRVRAELAHVRGQTKLWASTLADAYETLTRGAVEVSSLDPRKALEMLIDAAIAGIAMGNYEYVTAAGTSALALAESLHEDEDRRLVSLLVGVANLHQGLSASDLPDVVDVVANADEFDDPRWIIFASGAAQVAGEETRSSELMRRAIALARESAQFEHLARGLASLVIDEVVVGRHLALAEAAEALELSTEAGVRNTASLCRACLAWFAAARGQDEQCRAHVRAATHEARATGNGFANAVAEWALSLLDLIDGRPNEAATRLATVSAAPPGVGHPYVALIATPDLVEALVRSGRHDQARTAFAALEAFAQADAPPWARALAARCRALLSTGSQAEREFEAALHLHADRRRPFNHARTALLYGEFLRRERRRIDAREQLQVALDGFEQIGAEAWAERARAELRASGETARKRDPSTISQLTPQELQIARMVADGLSNKEVAAHLFLSPRTIDSHLRNIFSKLGITSRTQLVRLPLEEAMSRAAVPA